MFWKKNAFSYCMWLVYSIVLGSIAVFALLYQLSVWPVSAALPLWGRVLIVLVLLGFVTGASLLIRRGALRVFQSGGRIRNKAWIAEIIIVILVMTLGLCSFGMKVSGTDGVSEIFGQAYVTEGSKIPLQSHGASYLYLCFLRGFFLFFGNKSFAALWLQIIILGASGLIFYRAVRSLLGKIPAMGMLMFWMLSPYMHELAMSFSPMVLYLLFYSAAFWILSVALEKRKSQALYFVPAGILAGCCVALDLQGITLLIWAFVALFMRTPTRRAVEHRLTGGFVYIGTTLLGWLLAAAIILFNSKFALSRLAGWWQMYAFEVPTLTAELLQEQMLVPGILLCGFLFVGVISFWLRKKADGFLPIMWVVAAALGIELSGGTSSYMDTELLILIPFILLALGAFCNVLDCREVVVSDKPDELPKQIEVKDENSEAALPDKVAEENLPIPTAKPVKFLENPLPVPKKRPHKSLEYSLNDIPEDDDYDCSVGDDEDYDF